MSSLCHGKLARHVARGHQTSILSRLSESAVPSASFFAAHHFRSFCPSWRVGKYAAQGLHTRASEGSGKLPSCFFAGFASELVFSAVLKLTSSLNTRIRSSIAIAVTQLCSRKVCSDAALLSLSVSRVEGMLYYLCSFYGRNFFSQYRTLMMCGNA